MPGGDSDGGRPEYTLDEVNNGALGPIGDNAKEQPDYPGTIVFNSISDSTIGHEFNFVGAREDTKVNAGINNVWHDEIKVEDGKTYFIRLYAHNNNPNAEDAKAKDTRVWFSIPTNSAQQIQINGFIKSSNATPNKYWDYVNFSSDTNFHLEYVYGSALLENNGIGSRERGPQPLNDNIINPEVDGVLIGYDALDGNIPGCYQYANYISIKVKVVFDYDFTVDSKVRLVDEDTWKDVVNADIGDKLEFQIRYQNTSDKEQTNVSLRNSLPSNLRYIPESAKLINTNYPDGTSIDSDMLIGDNGIRIGNYAAGSTATVSFTAEVVNNDQEDLVHWSQVSVGTKEVQNYTRIVLHNNMIYKILLIISGTIIIISLILIIILFIRRRRQIR